MATDVRNLGASPAGLVSCSAAVNAGIAGGGEFIFQNGTFLFDESIKIPSNTTIYIKNAILKMADTSYDNFFRNSNFNGGNVNINIKGLGNAVLDGNSANNDDDYATYGPATPVSDTMYRYMPIVLCDVEGFEISGINIVDYMHWCIFLQNARGTIGSHAVVKDIYFNYYTTTANQDGIDIMNKSSYIDISNIKGYFGDDTFAMSVGEKAGVFVNITDWNVGDIHDITINGVDIYSTPYHGFITLGGDGNKIYNINASNWGVMNCLFFTYFGLSGYYNVAPVKEDIQDIAFDNITIIAQADVGAVIRVTEDCQDIAFTNYTNSTGKADYSEGVGLDVENFTINGADQSP